MTRFDKKAGLAMAAAAALALSACASGHGGGFGAGYGPGPGPDAFDTYYDGFYGDVDDGYWGPDQAFYYHGHDGRFTRDGGNHFRHQSFSGAHGMHAGHAPK